MGVVEKESKFPLILVWTSGCLQLKNQFQDKRSLDGTQLNGVILVIIFIKSKKKTNLVVHKLSAWRRKSKERLLPGLAQILVYSGKGWILKCYNRAQLKVQIKSFLWTISQHCSDDSPVVVSYLSYQAGILCCISVDSITTMSEVSSSLGCHVTHQ